MSRMSIATIDSPEFINVSPYNPLISECEIKVLYLGENRNHSYISKEVATEMANSLPGCPIVGYFKQDVKDFGDHGDQVVIDENGIHFNCLTKPYGFVAPNAKIWFQKFEDTDDFGNSIIREYLMTTGFLWTGQFEEAQAVVEHGKPHSMELDEESLKGEWSKNYKTGIDFFIINDAIFSKLCILGDKVEPCFEGSNITAPYVSTSFTKVDDNFKKTLYTMMHELKDALEGGQMALEKDNKKVSDEKDKKEQNFSAENQNSTEGLNQTDFVASDKDKKEKEEAKKDQPKNDETTKTEENDEDKKKNFVKKEEDKTVKEEKTNTEDSTSKEDKKDDNKASSDDDDEEEKKKNDKYTLLEAQYQNLQSKYSALEEDFQSLVAFKNQIENEKKDALINSFYMLSDEDKKDVVTNKAKYSLDDIEAKLSVICVRKKVNFDLENTSKNEKDNPVTTFSLEEQDSSIPAWINALKNTRNSRND